jgi:hypothetical protein
LFDLLAICRILTSHFTVNRFHHPQKKKVRNETTARPKLSRTSLSHCFVFIHIQLEMSNVQFAIFFHRKEKKMFLQLLRWTWLLVLLTSHANAHWAGARTGSAEATQALMTERNRPFV